MAKAIEGTKPRGRQKRTDKDNETAPAAERGTLPGEGRKTYIVKNDLAGKIEGIAKKENSNIKDVVNTAFGDLVSKYEKKHGPVELVEKKQQFKL
jgi:hypothetical protein